MVEKNSVEAGIFLIKMNITHFTVVNLEILTVKRWNLNYDTVTLKLIEEES